MFSNAVDAFQGRDVGKILNELPRGWHGYASAGCLVAPTFFTSFYNCIIV